MMTASSDHSPPPLLNTDNPWPGLAAFTEKAQDSFNGRDVEAEELLRRVTATPLTILFGKSGLGKTSLLQAGLFPRLRRRNILPVYVRLQIRAEAPPLMEQMRAAFIAQIAESKVEAPSFAEHESLWEYLHRRELELWSTTNYLLTPLFVLDQFEEIFTFGEQMPQAIEEFRFALGNLAENRIPSTIVERIENSQEGQETLDVRALRYGVLLSLREDFLPHLEGWRRTIPSLGRNRMRLLPMSPQQAYAAVHDTAPHLTSQEIAWKIVDFVSAASLRRASRDSGAPGAETLNMAVQEAESSQGEVGGTIEPALLSLFCSGLYERHKKQHDAMKVLPPFDESLLEGAKGAIIVDYYRECLQGLSSTVSRFIEEELITDRGYRNSYVVEDAISHGFITSGDLDLLINRRLLRRAEQYDVARVELTHDVLTQAVREERDRRRVVEEKQREEEERQRTEEEKRRKEEKQREVRDHRNRLRWRFALFVFGLVSFAVINLMKSNIYAKEQQKIAEEQQKIAEEQKQLAEQRLTEATKAQNGVKNLIQVNQQKAFKEKEIEKYLQLHPEIYDVAPFSLKEATEFSPQPSVSRPLIYMQIQSDQQRTKAKRIGETLEKEGYDAPGSELLDYGPTARTEVRFFRKDDERKAKDISTILQSENVKNVTVTYIPGYENSKKVKPNLYEIWFAPDALTE